MAQGPRCRVGSPPTSAADIAGYSRLMHDDEAAAVRGASKRRLMNTVQRVGVLLALAAVQAGEGGAMPTKKAVPITKAGAGFEQRPGALSRGSDDGLVNAAGPAADLRR